MNPNLAFYRWWMPSARSFFTQLSERAAQGANTVVLLNDLTEPADMATQLAEIIQQSSGLPPYTLDLSSRPGVEPLMEMSHALRVHGQYSVELLPGAGETRQVLIVYGMDAVKDRPQAWARLAREWASVAQNGRPGNTMILICRYFGQPMPASVERFAYLKWNSEAAALETSLCCRLYGQANQVDPCRQRWIEAMISSLAPGDEAFAGFLWNSVFDSQENLFRRMKDYAVTKGWHAYDARRLHPISPNEIRALIQQKSKEIGIWWGRGWLIKTTEYDYELHSALLALIEEGCEVLERRLWRAQAAITLPEIDSFRSRLLVRANRYFPKTWQAGEITELGEMETFLKAENNFSPGIWQLLDDTYFTRQIRNDLAHYQPIKFDRYQELLRRSQA
jgi:hypothetical protein